MCGIFGYIGQPTHPKANYALLNQLAVKTEHRGKEATGIWGAQGGVDGQIIYHKEPITATKFIEKPLWKSLRKFNPNVLLVHCREPTTGVGVPSINKNNHPHVNEDYTIGLIHNGRVEEYHRYKHRFDKQIKSQCDSELLLRVFETGELVPDADLLTRYPHLDAENFNRLYGVEQIFKRFEKTHMAVAVGERHEGTKRSLWLFRNEKRPMQIIDLRSSMGAIYFCSTMSIWREAVEATPEVKNIIPLNHDVTEFPVQYAYALKFDPAQPDEVYTEATAPSPEKVGQPVEGGWKQGWRLRKYKLNLSREEGEEDTDFVLPTDALRPIRSVQVYTGLNADDEIQGAASVIRPVATGHEDTVETPAEADPEPDPDSGDVSSHLQQTPTTAVIGPVYQPTYEPEDETTTATAVEAEPETDPLPEPPPVKSGKRRKKVEKDDDDDNQAGYDLDRLSDLVQKAQDEIKEIGVEAHNNVMEGNVGTNTFDQVVDGVEQLLADASSLKYLVMNGKQ